MDRFSYVEQTPSAICDHCECNLGSDELVCIVDDGFLCEGCYEELKDKLNLNSPLVKITEYI